jgi:tight adherence protein B
MINKLIEYVLLIMGVGVVGYGVYFSIFRNFGRLEAGVINRISGYAREIYDLLDKMFKRKTMNYVYGLILIPTLVFGLIGLAVGLGVSFVFSVVLALAFGFFGFKLPGIVVRFLFKRRVELFEIQMVDALNMIASSVRSGLSFLQAIQVIEQEMKAPCSEEFGMVLKENRVGVSLNEALLNMTQRVPSDDLFMIMNSVVTLSQSGGDLTEAFDTIAETIRERQRVKDRIRTLSQAGLTQATILSLIPFVFLGINYFISPAYVTLLFTTPLGIGFLVAMFAFIGVGVLWMKKILTIEV